jgi:arylsulfatase A-like enzyme
MRLARPLLAFVLPWLAVTRAPAQQAVGTPARPNVVWLVAEDMSPWLGCYGDRTVPTPNCDRLAREGVRYANAFATSPVCAPARSSLITGMYATRIGTVHMRTGNPSEAELAKDARAYAEIPNYEGVPPSFVRCFPELLRKAGYFCTNNQKTDYQFRAPVTVWDGSGGKAHWRQRAPGQPFFAVFNFDGTHESGAFPKTKAKPRVVDPATVSLPPFYPDSAAVRDAVARTYDNIAAFDRWVGDRLAELEQSGVLGETIVMLYSDHGVGLPRGKRSCYDTGTRVPLLVRFGDAARKGEVEARVVQFVDFAPTVLSLCGIDPDVRLDGVPFLGRFARAGDGFAFAHADRFDAAYDQQRAVSDGRYRLVRNYRRDLPYLLANAYREQLPMTAELHALRGRADLPAAMWQMAATERPAEELYDSAADRWEVDNRIADRELADRAATLRAALDGWIAATSDLGLVQPERRMVEEELWHGAQQPTTPPAVDTQAPQGAGHLVALACAEAGASIGYRLLPVDRDQRFAVYRGPMMLAAGQRLEVVTHRIGWRPSTREVRVGPRRGSPSNVLVIVVDDLGYMDIGANNPDCFYETPNLDRLAAQSLRCTDGYAACPVCSPTRYSLLTGRYPARGAVTNWFMGTRAERFRPAEANDRMALEEVTLAELLRERGRATMFAGKWHLGPSEPFWPEHQGFDVNRGGWSGGGPYGGKQYFSPYGNPRLVDGPDGEHLPARLAAETGRFLEQHRDRPFLAWLSFYSVHTPLMGRPDLVAKYEAKLRAMPAPSDAAPEFGDEEQAFLSDQPRKVRRLQRHAVYAAMVEAMDQAVGQVLNKLDELGLTDDTIVVFTSDNGGLSTSEGSPTSNLPLRGGKGWMYEGGIRAPWLWRVPGVTSAGATSAVPFSSVDLLPTLLELLGAAPVPHAIDGVSIAPVLRGAVPAELRERPLFWHYPHYGNQGGFPAAAVRRGDWKLIERLEDGRVHLFDLAHDIGEQRDLAAEQPERTAQLRRLLHDWYRTIGARFLRAKDGVEPWRPQ